MKEFVEVESGKNNDRLELAKALKHCQLRRRRGGKTRETGKT